MLQQHRAVAVLDDGRADHLQVLVLEHHLLVVLLLAQAEGGRRRGRLVAAREGRTRRITHRVHGGRAIARFMHSPLHEVELVAVVDAQVAAGGDVPDAHGVVPVDEAARPLGARQLEAPQRARLAHHAAALVHHDAAKDTRAGRRSRTSLARLTSTHILRHVLLPLRLGPARRDRQALVAPVEEA